MRASASRAPSGVSDQLGAGCPRPSMPHSRARELWTSASPRISLRLRRAVDTKRLSAVSPYHRAPGPPTRPGASSAGTTSRALREASMAIMCPRGSSASRSAVSRPVRNRVQDVILTAAATGERLPHPSVRAEVKAGRSCRRPARPDALNRIPGRGQRLTAGAGGRPHAGGRAARRLVILPVPRRTRQGSGVARRRRTGRGTWCRLD